MNIYKNFFAIFFVVVLTVFLQSCATTSVVASAVDVGMNREQVRIAAGNPWTKNAYKNSDGSAHEEWIYRETTWDDGGWSWDRTMFNTHIIFTDDRVEAIVKDNNEIYKTKIFVPPQSSQVNIQQNNF